MEIYQIIFIVTGACCAIAGLVLGESWAILAGCVVALLGAAEKIPVLLRKAASRRNIRHEPAEALERNKLSIPSLEEATSEIAHEVATEGKKAVVLYKKGWKAYHASDYKKAAHNFRAALDLVTTPAIQLALGIVLSILCDYPKALNLLEAASERYKEDKNQAKHAAALGNIGIVYKDTGEPQKALKNHMAALEINQEIDNKLGKAQDRGNIGLVYRNISEPKKALENLEAALNIQKEIGNRLGEGHQLGNIGLVYQDTGEPKKALENYKDALEIFEKLRAKLEIALALGNIGLIYRNIGEPKKALQNLNKARDIFKKLGAKHLVAQVEGIIAKLEQAMQESS